MAASNPNGLLKIAPSKEKLLNWSLRPPKEPLLAVGSKRVKSAADLEIVGSVVNSLRPTLVSAPVRSLPKTPLVLLTVSTTSSSCAESGVRLNAKFSVFPKVKNTSEKD